MCRSTFWNAWWCVVGRRLFLRYPQGFLSSGGLCETPGSNRIKRAHLPTTVYLFSLLKGYIEREKFVEKVSRQCFTTSE